MNRTQSAKERKKEFVLLSADVPHYFYHYNLSSIINCRSLTLTDGEGLFFFSVLSASSPEQKSVDSVYSFKNNKIHRFVHWLFGQKIRQHRIWIV